MQYLSSSSISRIYIRSMIEWRSRHQKRRLVGARDIVQVAVMHLSGADEENVVVCQRLDLTLDEGRRLYWSEGREVH